MKNLVGTFSSPNNTSSCSSGVCSPKIRRTSARRIEPSASPPMAPPKVVGWDKLNKTFHIGLRFTIYLLHRFYLLYNSCLLHVFLNMEFFEFTLYVWCKDLVGLVVFKSWSKQAADHTAFLFDISAEFLPVELAISKGSGFWGYSFHTVDGRNPANQLIW